MAKKTKPVNIRDLTKLVTWLDGYSVMTPVDPIRLRRIVNKSPNDQAIESAWKEIEKDVWDIARVPSTSPAIVRLSRVLNILKQVLMFIGLIVLTVYLVGSGMGAFAFAGRYSTVLFVIIFVAVYLLGFGSYFYLDRRLTRLVNACYQQHANEISRQRKHIKQVNQRLIDMVAAEIRAKKADPEKYSFALVQKDYTNIVVQKEQNNSTYLVTVKGSKRTV